MPHNYNFDFKLISDSKIQPAITDREDSCFCLFSPCSRVGNALRPIITRWSRSTFDFYALIGQNLTGESMRKINAAS